MATLKALAALGQSIVADIADAKDSAANAVKRWHAERQIVSDFKTLLREEPLAVAKAFKHAADGTQPAKRQRRKAAQK